VGKEQLHYEPPRSEVESKTAGRERCSNDTAELKRSAQRRVGLSRGG
jgi:hypothetical protein